MGWGLQRADGSFRGWCRYTQDDVLRAGEVWIPLETAPNITPDALTLDTEKQSLAISFADDIKLKAVIRAVLDEIDGRHGNNPVDRLAFRARVIGYIKASL